MNTLTLKNSGNKVSLALKINPKYITKSGTLIPFKKFAPANYAELEKPAKKEISASYDAIRTAFWKQNRENVKALTHIPGVIFRKTQVRTSKTGVVNFTITGGEAPKGKVKALSKANEIEALKAEIEALKALAKSATATTVDVPIAEVSPIAIA